MSSDISNLSKLIVAYTNDYAKPKQISPVVWRNSEEKARIEKASIMARDLIERFALSTLVGGYQVTEYASKQSVTLKVTKFIDKYFKEIYQVWLDQGPLTINQGYLELEILTKLPSGWLFSPYRAIREKLEPSDLLRALQVYSQRRQGVVYIDLLDSFGREKFHGIGTGLMQIAAEVSSRYGFGVKLMLQPIDDSHGFYRKLHLSTGDPHQDKAIDMGVPNREDFVDYMFVLQEAEEAFLAKIAKSPILY